MPISDEQLAEWARAYGDSASSPVPLLIAEVRRLRSELAITHKLGSVAMERDPMDVADFSRADRHDGLDRVIVTIPGEAGRVDRWTFTADGAPWHRIPLHIKAVCEEDPNAE